MLAGESKCEWIGNLLIQYHLDPRAAGSIPRSLPRKWPCAPLTFTRFHRGQSTRRVWDWERQVQWEDTSENDDTHQDQFFWTKILRTSAAFHLLCDTQSCSWSNKHKQTSTQCSSDGTTPGSKAPASSLALPAHPALVLPSAGSPGPVFNIKGWQEVKKEWRNDMLDIGLFTPNGPIMFSYHGSACSWNSQTERGSTEITHDMSPHAWVTSCTTWSKSAGEHLPMSPHPPTTMDKRTLAVPLYRTGPPSPQYPLEPTRSQVVSRGNQRSECECHEGLCWAEAEAYKNMQKMLQTTWNGLSHGRKSTQVREFMTLRTFPSNRRTSKVKASIPTQVLFSLPGRPAVPKAWRRSSEATWRWKRLP